MSHLLCKFATELASPLLQRQLDLFVNSTVCPLFLSGWNFDTKDNPELQLPWWGLSEKTLLQFSGIEKVKRGEISFENIFKWIR